MEFDGGGGLEGGRCDGMDTAKNELAVEDIPGAGILSGLRNTQHRADRRAEKQEH